jgi:hypothetical protein
MLSTPLERLPREVAAVVVLAEMAREDAPSAALERVYFIVPHEGAPPPGLVRRAGGPPIGVDERTRPALDGAFMHHLVTLDLDEVPELRRAAGLADARAVALFVSDHGDHDAVEPGSDEVAVVALSDSDVRDKGEWRGPEVDDPAPRFFSLVPIDVPAGVFAAEAARADVEFSALEAKEGRFGRDALVAMLRQFVARHAKTPAARLAALRSELMNDDHAGGRVVYWSEHTYDEDFLFQFTEDLLDVDLGDDGTMYVFAKTAFVASH